MRIKLLIFLTFTSVISCKTGDPSEDTKEPIRLITLDPGHFHAALVQKTMYEGVDSTVHVYAPEGPDVGFHLDRIRSFNTRATEPTNWNEEVYRGSDFVEKMLRDKAGNVVVLAGNNQRKTEYILRSVEAGYNVLSDKPMAINTKNFEVLKQAFDVARKNNLVLYDIMTERYEINTILQREFSRLPNLFGTLEAGTPENPAVTKESVHYFYKYVSGKVLVRPPWFMDVEQEGDGIVDVTTHLVDLIQWECFPEEVIDYTKDVHVSTAKRWATEITLDEFKAITKTSDFPGYLKKDVVKDTVLEVYSNGEIHYQLKGIHAKVSVVWGYKAPEGTGDTHYSIMRGTKANLIIRQGKEEEFKPVLYIEPTTDDPSFEGTLNDELRVIQANYPGVKVEKLGKSWKVIVPETYKEGHEAHFARVTEKFLEYLNKGNMPDWEVPNMIAKYYTTTKALEIAKEN